MLTKVEAAAPRALITNLLFIAFAERFGWAIQRGWDSQAGEATNVAAALARGRGFADPYFIGSGPTAHLMPTTPVLAGAVYWLIGYKTVSAEVVLQIISCVEMATGYLLAFFLFGRLAMPLRARMAALMFLCIVPLFMGQESLDFRYWEGGVAVVLLELCLLFLMALHTQTAEPSQKQIWTLAILFAITFFTSPSIGLGIAASILFLFSYKASWRTRTGMVAASIACLVSVFAPWAIRNEAVLGKPIILRSNFGLELAVANNDRQVVLAHKAAFAATMASIHPSTSPRAQNTLSKVGEIRFMSQVGKLAENWVLSHPAQFIGLSFRHLRQMVAPEPFQFEIGSGAFSRQRSLVYSLLGVLGIIGLLVEIASGNRGYLFVAIVIAVVDVTYMPFQPMARYLYLNYALLTFCSFGLIARLASFLYERHTPAPRCVLSGDAG